METHLICRANGPTVTGICTVSMMVGNEVFGASCSQCYRDTINRELNVIRRQSRLTGNSCY